MVRQNAERGGKKLLCVNMDETHILCHDSSAKGTVVRATSVHQAMPKCKRKRSVTFVALVADHGGAQQKLVQYVLANEQTFRKKDMSALTTVAGERLHLVRSS